MNRSKPASHNIYTVFVALTVPFLIVIPVRAQEPGNAAGSTKSGIGATSTVSSDSKTASTADGASTASSTTSQATPEGENAPVKRKKIIFKPGVPLTITTANETVKVTNDAKLARDQVATFPDSPEAHFVLAVALTRTSQVEEALKEVRNARKLASQKGGAAYFDSMINEYETMLKNYPEDNQVRYHLAWAYYMKAYVLARYSKSGAPKPPPALPTVAANPKATGTPDPAKVASTESGAVAPARAKNWQSDWVKDTVLTPEELAEDAAAKSEIASRDSKTSADAAAKNASSINKNDSAKIASVDPDKGYVNLGEEPEAKKPAFTPPVVAPANGQPHANNNFWSNPLGSLTNLGPITGMEYATANAAPEVVPQVKAYYRRALKKLDEVLEKEPEDLWARLYRAHLGAEYSGDIESAMKVWESCREAHPNNPAPYFFLGEGYLKKGDLRQCLTNVSKAIALRSVGN